MLSKRLPASKYSYQFPIGKVDRQILIEFFEELEITLPKFVIIAEEIGDMEKFLNNNNYFCANEIDGRKGYIKDYPVNYIEELSDEEYRTQYRKVSISPRILNLKALP